MPTFLVCFDFLFRFNCFCSTYVHYLRARPPTVYKHFMFFLKFKEEKITMRIRKDMYFHQMNNKNTLRNEDYCAIRRTLGLISVVVCFFYLCWQCYFIDYQSLYFFLKATNISFVKKRRHNCSLSCTHKKVDHVSGRQGFQSTNSTPFNVRV